MIKNRIVIATVMVILGVLVLIINKSLRENTLELLYKVGLAEEVCSNAEIVGDIALPIYRCTYRLSIF